MPDLYKSYFISKKEKEREGRNERRKGGMRGRKEEKEERGDTALLFP